jgi:8-oxo-dGTP pyrophosphatase MutT (NUDIX family)
VTVLPWTRLSSREVCDCRVFKVRSVQYRSPKSGETHDFFVVDCPDWVNTIALTVQGEVLLVRQHRFGIDQLSLEIPGGMVDPGEGPAEAATRELLEETGYRGDPPRLLGTIHPNPALQPNRTHTFLISGCRRVAEPTPDAAEDLEVELVPPEQIDALLLEGRISHALVATAFLHWRLRGCPGSRAGAGG